LNLNDLIEFIYTNSPSKTDYNTLYNYDENNK